MLWLLISFVVIYLLIGFAVVWLLTGIAPGGHQNNWNWRAWQELLPFGLLWPYYLFMILKHRKN